MRVMHILLLKSEMASWYAAYDSSIGSTLQALIDRRRVLLIVLLACLFLTVPMAQAADITLSSTCSLANAVRSANGDDQVAPANSCAAGDASGSDSIHLVADIALSEVLPDFTSNIIIHGGGHKLTTTVHNSRLMYLAYGRIEIRNLEMSNAPDSAIIANHRSDNELRLIVLDSTFSNNAAGTHGGAILADDAVQVTIMRSHFNNNSATGSSGGDGAAIFVSNGSLAVHSSSFSNNSGIGDGGAIFFKNSSDSKARLIVSDSKFMENAAIDDDENTNRYELGGAIYYSNSSNGASEIRRSSFSGHEARFGGGVYMAGGKLTINNSTFDSNSAASQGGGIYVNGGELTVRHATIVKNTAANGAGMAVFQNLNDASQNPTVKIYNSIIAKNTDSDETNSACLANALSVNQGNIIEDTNCGVAAQTAQADLLLEMVDVTDTATDSAVKTRYYRLMPGSPAIDAGARTGLSQDQRGMCRPQGAGFDIGSYEMSKGHPCNSERRSDDSDDATEEATPAQFDPMTCATLSNLDNGIKVSATHGLESGVQCQEISARGIGIQSVIDAGFIKAVDIWGFVGQGVQVCFDDHGPLLFLDAATAPRTVMSIASFALDGKTCATIYRPGSIVLQMSQTSAAIPATAVHPSVMNEPTPTLPPGCMVTTTAVLNFRDGPNGNFMGEIPQSVTLTVLASARGWYEVDWYGTAGWISAYYTKPNAACRF